MTMKGDRAMEIPNYLIHLKLKKGRDYPSELLRLIKIFQEGDKALLFTIKKGISRIQVNNQIRLIEKTFLDFFLNHDSQMVDPCSIEKFQKCYERSKPLCSKSCSTMIIKKTLDRINRKLGEIHPFIIEEDLEKKSYSFNPFSYFNSRNAKHFFKNPRKHALEGWLMLAKVIVGLKPNLVHKCEVCGKIFFSKQRKRYHPECYERFISEKRKKEGLNKKYQEAYRQRKKEKLKTG